VKPTSSQDVRMETTGGENSVDSERESAIEAVREVVRVSPPKRAKKQSQESEVKELTREQKKLEKAREMRFPWTNTDKISVVQMKLMSIDYRTFNALDEEVTPLQNDSDVFQKAFIFSVQTLPYILAMVRGAPTQLWIDTGSTLNLIDSKECGKETLTPVSGIELTSASGHPIKILGKITLNIRIGNLTLPCQFMVIAGLEMKYLLGNAIFQAYKVILNYNSMDCHFTYNDQSSGPIPLLLQTAETQMNLASETMDVVLESNND